MQWASVTVPLCASCGQRWRMGTVADSVALAALCVAPFAFIYTATAGAGPSPTGLVAQSVLYIAAVAALNVGVRSFSRAWVLRAHDIDASRVWVTGLHPTAEAAYCAAPQES
jgi:hypothetical protein